MTGKEALDDYKDFGKIKGESITSNQTFVPSPFHNEWRQKYFEEADMVCARNDELENKLAKYKRAFEILKDYSIIPPLEDFRYSEHTNCYFAEIEEYDHDYEDYRTIHYVLEKEEYELLEELMKDAKD